MRKGAFFSKLVRLSSSDSLSISRKRALAILLAAAEGDSRCHSMWEIQSARTPTASNAQMTGELLNINLCFEESSQTRPEGCVMEFKARQIIQKKAICHSTCFVQWQSEIGRASCRERVESAESSAW